MKKLITISLLCISFVLQAKLYDSPHILVNNKDKEAILLKVEKQPWAKKIIKEAENEVSFYVEQHARDNEWILSRYLMNRVPGKRYTRFISDREGTKLVAYEGDAPVPTVRVSPHKRSPVTPEGQFYVAPKIKDLVPYDTSLTMNLKNPATNKYERVDPQNYVNRINTSINKLAFSSAVLYWLTGEEKYACFSADILNQWAAGAVHQELITGPGRVGFLDIQTLGDEGSKPLILAYDFVKPYMESKGYNLDYYDIVFEKIAETLAFRGYVGNNWYAAESSTMVAAALSLTDKKKRDYYLSFYLTRDTIHDGCGQLAMPSTVKKWFTPDGHWKEPGGYHNYPVSKLIESAMMLENNGIEVFNKYPQLFDAAHVMLKYSFPDLTASSFGDTGRPVQSPYCLEIAIRKAHENKLPILSNLLVSMHQLLDREIYDRSEGGLEGLLCYLPELPSVNADVSWERTGKLDFASFYFQRNGMERQTGLMCAVQGATYNHNHSNGMAMEIYGKGTVMGIDPGNGPTYEHPMHVRYYTQWAAHNTVVAAGASTSIVPFHGGGGTKQIGQVNLISMEPLVGNQAVSDNYSFTLTEYYDGSTKTNQQRLLSLIRIDENEGYYLDIYRSDNPVSNDYLYHNIGESVSFYTMDADPVILKPVDSYPKTENDEPGLRFFEQVETTGIRTEGLIALFSVSELPTGKAFMKMWIPGVEGRTYFKAMAPISKTAVSPYNKKKTPVIGIRMEQEAFAIPFVVLFEPTEKGLSSSIKSVKQHASICHNHGVILEVETIQNKKQFIFTSLENKEIAKDNYSFSGDYGVIEKDGEITTYYLGFGNKLSDDEMLIETKDQSNGSVCLINSRDKLYVRTKQPCRILFKDKERGSRLSEKDTRVRFSTQSGYYEWNIEEGEHTIKYN